MAEPISPLADLAQPGEYGALIDAPEITLSEELPTALVQVACWPETENTCRKALVKALGVTLNSGQEVSLGDEVTALPTGPGRWLIDSSDVELEKTLRAALKPEIASVTNLTHARVMVNVSGEKSAWLLATGVALDFHIDAFPVNTVQVSRHHEVGLTIRRVSDNEFELYLFTSFARSFWQWITKAAAEIGYRVN